MYTIYYDSLTEATWFQDLSPHLKDANFEIIQRRGQNLQVVEELLTYDKPDIILLKNHKPVLVLEKTTEVPTGHNVGQRFARLVRAVELGVLTIYYFPYDARKHGRYSSLCNLNIRLIDACLNIEKIHGVPLLTVNWPADSDGELIMDGTENERISALLNDCLQHGFNDRSPEVVLQLKKMQEDYDKRLKAFPKYGHLPPSVERYKTHEFCKKYNIEDVDKSFAKREFTYVYKMIMTPAKCKRQDPYTGTQFIYDYMVCRNGVLPSDKKNNLVLYFPILTKEIWFEKNPNDISSKSCNWYLTANGLLFKDAFFFNNLIRE